MAGGIDWFRWHHGTVTDQKFPLVARRAGASVAEVIAVWACLLESASMNETERGLLSAEPDFEAMDCALGLTDGKACAIFQAMQQRSLVDEHLHVVAWPKRQPKREDDTAAERKRRQRERDHAISLANAVTQAESRNVTPSHDRGEESREEKNKDLSVEDKSSTSSPVATKRPSVPCPYEAIVEAYHSALPMLPRVRVMDEKRKGLMRKRWAWVLSSSKADGTPRATNGDEALAWFAAFFDRAGHSGWLTGRTPGRGHEGWTADLDFLMTDRGLKAVVERTEVAA